MDMNGEFQIAAPRQRVWEALNDPEVLRQCIPGCEELVQTDDSHYKGTLVNEVAHVRFKAGFTAEVVSVSEAVGGPAVVHAVLRGEDRRLGSTIRMDATLKVVPVAPGDTSEVDYAFELAIRGKLGRLGESVIRRRTAEVERQFAEALTAVCAGRPVPQAVSRNDRSDAAAPAPREPALVPATQAAQPRQDWLVIGLAVAAAFAYGILVGDRMGGRR